MHFLLQSLLLFFSLSTAQASTHWSVDQANQWASKEAWRVGNNYLPSDAVNALEMWQSESFNPILIDRELGWAEELGMTTVRVFLHDLLWKSDSEGFKIRLNTFLSIAARHHIKPLLVLFDSCWDPAPHLGKQSDPKPGVHNSRWVQSPGFIALRDPAEHARLRTYIKGLIRVFGHDPRILAWDLWNEPDNLNDGSYFDPKEKVDYVQVLLPQVFAWARSVSPEQPLTSGVWAGELGSDEKLSPIQFTQLHESDVISFHSYADAKGFTKTLTELKRFHRPLLLTEYMARPLGSTLETILPIARANHIVAYNWGFIAGKSQTYIPWDSWRRAYSGPPSLWFHDLLYPDGKPYLTSEIQFLKNLLLK